MLVISHRGYWLEKNERNCMSAFKRSFELGFGTETDVRDFGSKLVISHDIPKEEGVLLSEVVALSLVRNMPLALNIKADGLAELIHEAMREYDPSSWFVFDMSIPDLRSHLACKNPVFSRVSEWEPEPVYFNEVQGIWLDAFFSDGWQTERVEPWLKAGKRVCLVSPELHGRDPKFLWEKIRDNLDLETDQLMICTNHPEEAREFFQKKDSVLNIGGVK